jgi:hypothetical protein
MSPPNVSHPHAKMGWKYPITSPTSKILKRRGFFKLIYWGNLPPSEIGKDTFAHLPDFRPPPKLNRLLKPNPCFQFLLGQAAYRSRFPKDIPAIAPRTFPRTHKNIYFSC